MNKIRIQNRDLVLFSLFAAIVILLGFTPLGIITLPLGLSATILHIPVIIGACTLGWKYGAGLGGLFGAISFITHSFIKPGVTSFIFTPLYSLDNNYHGSFWSIIVCFLPRILIGVFSALVFKAVRKRFKAPLAAAAAGAVGALTNTTLVLSGISIFFGADYAEIKGKLLSVIIKTAVVVNGIPELIGAIIISMAIVPICIKLREKK